MQANEYLVTFGPLGDFGRFRSTAPDGFHRATLVVRTGEAVTGHPSSARF